VEIVHEGGMNEMGLLFDLLLLLVMEFCLHESLMEVTETWVR
jgi:hypothetical protein